MHHHDLLRSVETTTFVQVAARSTRQIILHFVMHLIALLLLIMIVPKFSKFSMISMTPNFSWLRAFFPMDTAAAGDHASDESDHAHEDVFFSSNHDEDDDEDDKMQAKVLSEDRYPTTAEEEASIATTQPLLFERAGEALVSKASVTTNASIN